MRSDEQAHLPDQPRPNVAAIPLISEADRAAMLSGGEKSLATLCFLLSLWDVCSFPIRCLGTGFRYRRPHQLICISHRRI